MPVRVDEEDFERVADADDANEQHDAALEPLIAGEIEGEDEEDGDGGDECCRQHGLGLRPAVREHCGAEEEIEAEGCAEKLGEVGGDGGDLGGDPEEERHGPGEVLAAVLGEGEAGDDAELGREVLDEDGHGVRPEEHPEQAIAEAAASFDIGGEVSRIDVGDRGHEGRAEVSPHLIAPEAWPKFLLLPN